jgi:hypothetical protein
MVNIVAEYRLDYTGNNSEAALTENNFLLHIYI